MLIAVSMYLATKLTVKRMARAVAIGLLFVIVPCATMFLLHPMLLKLRQDEFRTALPLFFYKRRIVDTRPKYAYFETPAEIPTLEGLGYPISRPDQPRHVADPSRVNPEIDATYPNVKNRKNVIYLTQERWRYDDWSDINKSQ
jgi:hypothetical protein